MLIRMAMNGAVHFAGGVALGVLGALAAKTVADTVRQERTRDQEAGLPDAAAYGEPPMEPRPAPD
jgi:hypothetical protein